jgi:hypothetical protein
MKLTAPSTMLFVISLVIAVLGVLAALGTLAVIPIASVWIVTVGYAILAFACLFKGA